MLNSDTKRVSGQDKSREPRDVSIILLTQNKLSPARISPQHIGKLVPKGISSEIIVIHYNQNNGKSSGLPSDGDNVINGKTINLPEIRIEDSIIHARINGKFTHAFTMGSRLAMGKLLLIIDADFPYPDELVPRLINELINSPHTLIIASKYAKGSPAHKFSFIKTIFSRGARSIVKHGLKVKDVQDPFSGCFALSRHLLENITIEGKGDELLLEILVKLKRNKNGNKVPIREIPFGQKGRHGTKKLDFDRLLSYSRAILHLYRYGRKSEKIQKDPDYIQQEKHKSVLFLSKAARFFTVGASGVVINYGSSFLLSVMIPGIWYIHATLFGILASITTNFLLNKIWTFEDRNFSVRHFFRQYLLFLVLCSLGAIIQLSLVFAFVEYSHIEYGLSLVMAVAIASLGNFLLNKKITFGEKIWE